MTNTLYHKLLRISALSLALVLLFVSGIFSPITKELSSGAGNYLATAIGINAAVLPTDVNTLSAQLAERDKELTQREIAVNLKESSAQTGGVSTYILSVLLFILLVLIVLNYLLDYLRTKQKELNEQTS
jgi:hypothetical protein